MPIEFTEADFAEAPSLTFTEDDFKEPPKESTFDTLTKRGAEMVNPALERVVNPVGILDTAVMRPLGLPEFQKPALSKEQVGDIAQEVYNQTLGTPGAVPSPPEAQGDIERGLKEFGKEMVSGLTTPENVIPLVAASKFATRFLPKAAQTAMRIAVPRLFQAKMAASVPQGVQAIQQAGASGDPAGVVKATAGTGLSAIAPVAINSALRKGALADAARIRENARQVPTPGNEPPGSAGESGANLEQPTPGQPSGPTPAQAQIGQTQPPRVLLTPEVQGHLDAAKSSINVPVEVTENISASGPPPKLTVEQSPDGTWRIIGDRPPEFQSLIAAVAKDLQPSGEGLGMGQRAFSKLDLEHMVKMASQRWAEQTNEPFFRPGQIATVRRGKNPAVLVNAKEMNEWLERDVPPEKRAEAMRTLLAHERNHLAVKPTDADTYWGTLTAAEKAIEKRLYTGEWKGRTDISETDHGFEAIRRRMERLARMDTTETVSLVGKERWKLKSLEALNDTIRGIREKIGKTEASKEGLRILDKVQENLDAGIVALGGAPSQPAALRAPGKTTPDDILKMSSEEAVKFFDENTARDNPAQRDAVEHGSNLTAADVPELKRMAAITRDQMMAALKTDDGPGYKAAMGKHIWFNGAIEAANKSGPNYHRFLADTVGAKFDGEVPAGAGKKVLQFTAFDETGKQSTSFSVDAGATPAEVRKAYEETRARWEGDPTGPRPIKEAAALRNKPKGEQPELLLPPLAPGQKHATAADLGAKPAVTAAYLTPDKIHWEGPRAEPALRHITEAESKSPTALSKILTADARTGGAQRNESVTHRVTALFDRYTGRIEVVSTYPHSRNGVMLADPSAITQDAARPHRQLSTLSDRYTPISSIFLKNPVQNFHERFASMKDFQEKFGNAAAEAASQKTGAAPQKFEAEQFPIAMQVEPGRVEPPPESDVAAVHDFFKGDIPKTPEAMRQRMLKGSASRQMIAALQKMLHLEQSKNPNLSAHEAIENALDNIYDDLSKAKDRADFTQRAMGRFAEQATRTDEPAGGAGAKHAEQPAEKSPTAAEALDQYDEGKIPTIQDLVDQVEFIANETGNERLRNAVEQYREAQRYDRELKGRGDMDEAEQQFIDAVRASEEPPRETAALRNLKRNIQDTGEEAAAAFSTMVNRHGVVSDVARSIDSTEQNVNNLAAQAEMGVRLKSMEKPSGRLAQVISPWTRGNKQVLSAANRLIEAGFNRAKLPLFQRLLDHGKQIGEAEVASPSWKLRSQGQKRLRWAKELQASLDYARAHWADADLQATARAAADKYDDIFNQEQALGYDVTRDPNYLPHRYVGGTRIGQRTHIMGVKFRQPKSFDTLFHAIADPNDVYIPASDDAASLVGHRARQSLNMILKDQWQEGLKAVDVGGGEMLAKEPKRTSRGVISPDPNYRLVQVRPGRSLAIHRDYADGIQNLTSPDWVEGWGPTRGALHLSQMLKHTLLIGDFFHLARMGYYGTSILGRKAGWKGGWSALDIAQRDIPEAVRRGVIRPEDAAWGNEMVQYGTRRITRRALVEKFYKEMGSNLGKVQDALYKDLITEGTAASSPLRRGLARMTDPTVGRYNRFLFDKLTRGLMAESVAREFERQSKANPSLNPEALMRDISRDVNNFYGNIGRQGWFKSAGMRSFQRMLWLAPQWVEGLVKKEGVAYGRLSGLASLTGQRQGVTALGTTGRSIGRAMAFMFGLTQAINLITRGKPTFKNEEEGHKMDAWIPSWGGDKEGFWFSPLAIFNELTHDAYRLIESKPSVMDAVTQIAGNKEQPMLRAAIVMGTGRSPTGEIQTTTMNRLGEAGKAMAPVPITFGRYAQAAGHAVAPKAIPATQPGAMQRQSAGTLGIKIEPALSLPQNVQRMAKRFMEKEGLTKETGWQQVQTDEPSYSKLRGALRANDDARALKMLNELRKTHTDKQILKAMKANSIRPFTGSRKTENLFLGSLTDQELEAYSKAREQMMGDFERFADFYSEQTSP